MGFYEDWHEQQARKVAERQALIEQAQAWVGCRVWVTYGVNPFFRTREEVNFRFN